MLTNGQLTDAGVISILIAHLEADFGSGALKYQHYIDAWGEVLPTPHRNNDSCSAFT